MMMNMVLLRATTKMHGKSEWACDAEKKNVCANYKTLYCHPWWTHLSDSVFIKFYPLIMWKVNDGAEKPCRIVKIMSIKLKTTLDMCDR